MNTTDQLPEPDHELAELAAMRKAKKITDYKEFIAYYGKQAAYWEQRLKGLDMTDTNELPEPELGYIQTDKSNQPAFSARQMREMKDTNQLPPHTITIHDHPEPHIMQWSDLELAAVKRYAEQYALQARAQVQGEPVYWEWRHLGNNQFAADFGQWSEWKRVEARNPIFTAEDELRTLRRYIADGYKYELRALHTTPQPAQAKKETP